MRNEANNEKGTTMSSKQVKRTEKLLATLKRSAKLVAATTTNTATAAQIRQSSLGGLNQNIANLEECLRVAERSNEYNDIDR